MKVRSLDVRVKYMPPARRHGKSECKDGKAEIIIWSSEYRSMADALELRGDEGRDKLR